MHLARLHTGVHHQAMHHKCILSTKLCIGMQAASRAQSQNLYNRMGSSNTTAVLKSKAIMPPRGKAGCSRNQSGACVAQILCPKPFILHFVSQTVCPDMHRCKQQWAGQQQLQQQSQQWLPQKLAGTGVCWTTAAVLKTVRASHPQSWSTTSPLAGFKLGRMCSQSVRLECPGLQGR